MAAVQEEVLRESKEKIQNARRRLSRPLRENLSLTVSEGCCARILAKCAGCSRYNLVLSLS